MNNLPIIIGITGASGSIYGIELLKTLKRLNLPTYFIITQAGKCTLKIETKYNLTKIKNLAIKTFDEHELTAPIASGSFPVAGMVIAPCSIKTLSAIVHCFNSNLLVRTADVQLKEHRILVLVVRETPLHQNHLELMSKAAKLGAIILPPIPAFYNHPYNIMDIIYQSIGKILDEFAIKHTCYSQWDGSKI